jgi:acyl-CoA thioesterase YciA
MSAEDTTEGRGEPAIRTMPLPRDANASGDIFGGWILSQMDLAGGIVAAERAGGRTVTVAVEGMKFHRPVFVGDTVSCYARIVRIGRSSITVDVETVARRRHVRKEVTVTEGLFTYVAVDDNGHPRAVNRVD